MFYSLKVLKHYACKKGFSSHGNRALTLANAGEGEKGLSSPAYPCSYKQEAGSVGKLVTLCNYAQNMSGTSSTTAPTCFELVI